MSSRKVCDSGTSAAPNTPCSTRNATMLCQAPGDAAQHRGDGEADDGDEEQLACRPKRSASQPVTGVMIAAATM